ncbi:MAG: MFS transporter [Dehalococcoidales bacterium]|nr:MFS transporter [Dehalococcoidales bacterium]
MKKIYYGWWVVAGAFLLFFCTSGSYFYSFPVFFDAILRDKGWSRTEVAGAISLGLAIAGVIAPFLGMLIRRMRIWLIMVIGSLVAGLGFFLLSTVSEPWHLYVYYGLIVSVGIPGIQLVPNFTIIGHWFYRRRSTALGVAAAGIGVGGAAMAPVAGWLIASYGWQKAFLFSAALVTVIGTLVAAFIMRTPAEKGIDTSEEQKGARAQQTLTVTAVSFREALRRRAFWFIAAGGFLWGWAYTAGLMHQVAFAVDIGIERIAAATAVGMLTAFSIAGRLGFGRLGDIIDKRYVFMTGCCLQVVAFIILCYTKNLTMLYMYSILLGLNTGAITPILPGLVSDYFGAKDFSVIYGTVFLSFTLGQMVGPVYAARIFDTTHSYINAFITSIVLSALAVVVMYLVGRPPGSKALPLPANELSVK